jgi:hypothetical protein
VTPQLEFGTNILVGDVQVSYFTAVPKLHNNLDILPISMERGAWRGIAVMLNHIMANIQLNGAK